jgi:ABC-type Fe3+/spermidine/putrescine transport system ATPase subunit
MQIELKQIQREVGITTIFVTHDQEEALTLSDRIAIFNEGRVVQVGAPTTVYERPVNAFAANFLGDANFFAGRSAGRRGGCGVVRIAADHDILTADPVPEDGAPVTLAVRPEKITLLADGATTTSTAAGPTENSLEGRIAQAVYSGNSISYRVEVGAGQKLLVFEQNRAARAVPQGATVRLAWPAAHTVVVAP